MDKENKRYKIKKNAESENESYSKMHKYAKNEIEKIFINQMESFVISVNSGELPFEVLISCIIAFATQYYSTVKNYSDNYIDKVDLSSLLHKITDEKKVEYINNILNMVHEKFTKDCSCCMERYLGIAVALFPEIPHPYIYAAVEDLERDLNTEQSNEYSRIIELIIKQTYGEKSKEFIEAAKRMAKSLSAIVVDKKKIQDQNIELEKVNEELSNANNKIRSMIRSFAHRAVHVEADNIFSVATTLQKNNGNPEDIKKLLLCYEENLELKRSINILKLESTNDYSAFKSGVRDSINYEETGSLVNIVDIINSALKRVFSKILYTDSERTMFIRRSMEQRGIDIKKLTEEYRNTVLVADGNSLEILCNNFDFAVKSVADNWKEVLLFKDSDGTTILMSLFMELFLNMFTYANLANSITLQLDDYNSKNYPYLSIEMVNSIKEDSKVFSSQSGLLSTNDTLKLLNSDKDGKNEMDEYIFSKKTEDGLFKTIILLRKYLFL